MILKKRNLFFITPLKGDFRIAFVFGEKAVGVVEKSDLPRELINDLLTAQKYAEGRGVRFEIRDKKHLENVKKLVDIKFKIDLFPLVPIYPFVIIPGLIKMFGFIKRFF